EEQSGIHDRRSVQRVQTLERDNQRLRAELEKVRQGGGTAQPQSREREFLNLRETITAKDRELLGLRDEVAGKDRELGDVREKLRQAQHAKTVVDAKNVELEGRLLGDSERVENAELAVQDLRAKLAAAEQKLSKAQAEIDRFD